MRLFLSIPIPDKLAQSLAQVQASLESSHWSLKATAPEKFHVTLHFLGETQENLLADLHHDLGACAHRLRPFDLKVGGLGAFPNFDDPRVLWMGVQDPAAKLQELFEATRRVLDPYRFFKLDETMRQAHVTLARVEALKSSWAAAKVIRAILLQWQSLGRLPVEEFQLLRSQQGRYELVEKFILGG